MSSSTQASGGVYGVGPDNPLVRPTARTTLGTSDDRTTPYVDDDTEGQEVLSVIKAWLRVTPKRK